MLKQGEKKVNVCSRVKPLRSRFFYIFHPLVNLNRSGDQVTVIRVLTLQLRCLKFRLQIK